MNRVGLVILAFVLMGLWHGATPRSVYACSCVPPPEPRDSLEQAATVFSGMVVSVSTIESSSGATRRAVTFDVISRWKGPSGAQAVVYTAMDSAACGFDFEVGKRYLVYTSGSETAPETGLCSRTKLLTVSGEDVAKLGPGMRPVAPDPSTPGAPGAPGVSPTSGSSAPETQQASFIPYVIPAAAVVVILMVLFLVILRGKRA